MGGICSARGKSKIVRVHAVKVSRGSRGRAPFFHNFGTSTEVCGQRLTPAALPPGNNLLNRKLGVPQSRSGLFEKKKVSCPYWDLNPRPSSPYATSSSA